MAKRFITFLVILCFVLPSGAALASEHQYQSTKEIENDILGIEDQIAQAEAKILLLQEEASELAVGAYRNRDTEALALLAAFSSPSNFVSYAKYVTHVAQSKERNAHLLEYHKELLKEEREKLDVVLEEFKKEQAFKKALHFPVLGKNWYIDSWGAPRDGGRRRHKGVDIMAKTGTPLGAITYGTVQVRHGRTAGLWVILEADSGWTYYYMHMHTCSVKSGQRVGPRQVIGTVGYSGNANANAPHLHFEVHPPGRGAVNPTPYVRQMRE